MHAASDAPAALRAAATTCLQRNDWICPEYVRTRADVLADAFREHLFITVVAVALGLLVALPLSVLTRRSRLMSGLTAGTATAVYTVPSLALLSFLLPVTGLSAWTTILALALYSLAILVRNILDGLDAVPPDAVDAARGVGYGPWRLMVSVQLPLALPSIMAGLRVATVSTVALATLGTIVAHGGFGNLITRGLASFFRAEVLTATVATVLLALVLDMALLATQRALTPWSRGRAA